MNLESLKQLHPLITKMSKGEEILWVNDALTEFSSSVKNLSVTSKEVEEAKRKLERFAPFIRACFPETAVSNGLIESPLREIKSMKKALNAQRGANIQGRLFLKMDSHLPVAGSVKARGGIYEILTYAEQLALSCGLIQKGEDYAKFTRPEMRDFFSSHCIHVGSTGNLGLSIGIISAAVGFQVYVHMSSDAKQWKKDLLRQQGVHVMEYSGDYSKAVKEGRRLAKENPKSYFVDDENSKHLFLGYAVAGERLKKQLENMHLTIDREHPLFVYIPCGVGGAPGGITFGLKQIYGDAVHIFFAEPTQACCMALGMISKMHDKICVQDIGLTGSTQADGLAVARPSKFIGRTIEHMLSGEFTLTDEKLYAYLKLLTDTENIFIEPSACAAFEGPARLTNAAKAQEYLKKYQLTPHMQNAIHVVWATGGNLVPQNVREKYYKKACDLEAFFLP